MFSEPNKYTLMQERKKQLHLLFGARGILNKALLAGDGLRVD